MIENIDPKALKSLNKVTEQVHTAAQFLAAAGYSFLENKPDHSHSNLGWLAMKEKFITHPFGTEEQFVMELSPSEMTITILNVATKNYEVLRLRGLTAGEVTSWIKKKLKAFKFKEAKKYSLQLPYDLPEYVALSDKKFKHSPKKAFAAFSKLRSWGDHFAFKYSAIHTDAEDVRTWPHHFDHASLIPVEKAKDGSLAKSIGIGLAIDDSMINEAYFYVSGWQKDGELDLGHMKDLSIGEWKNEGYKGSVLPISQVAGREDFEELIDSFFSESIQRLSEILTKKAKSKNGGKK